MNSGRNMIQSITVFLQGKEEEIMAQLWGGRFTKETDKLVYAFNASISFDKRFYRQDIAGSIAHVTMLEKQGILTKGFSSFSFDSKFIPLPIANEGILNS